jgi:hypothetical protein
MRNFTKVVCLAFMLLCWGRTVSRAQQALATPGALVKEVLATLSGEETKTRDMAYFKQLFHPKAQLTVVNARDNGEKSIVVFGLDEFVEVAGKNYQNAFFYEEEIASRIDEYNGIAQVFQSFTLKASNRQEQGINSYQLAFDGKRWWVVSLIWTNNRNGVAIPEKYLKNP